MTEQRVTKVSSHAMQQFNRYVDATISDKRILLTLWWTGKRATAFELEAFCVNPRAGSLYHVNTHNSLRFLMAATNYTIVTVFSLERRQERLGLPKDSDWWKKR